MLHSLVTIVERKCVTMATYLAALLVLSFVCYGNAIRCWTCSSDLDPHCGDPFNHTSPTFNLHHTLTNCDTQVSPNYQVYSTRSVCKKAVKTEYGRQVVSRSCEWLRNRDDTVGECTAATFNTPSYSKVEFCETCDTDGCNGAESLTSLDFWKMVVPVCIAFWLRY